MHIWSTHTLPSSTYTLLTPLHAATALVFGVPLVDLVIREERAIPYIVQKIVEHMEEEGEEGGKEGGRRGKEEGEGGRKERGEGRDG